jgi:hypothetical protein
MMQVDRASAFGGCQDGEANLERGQPPFTGMKRRSTQNHGVVELVDNFRAGNFWRREFFDVTRFIAIDHDGLRHRAKVSALATHDNQAEMVVGRIRIRVKSVAA